METSELFVVVAERLRLAEVPFAVIGAVAMSTHGFPRQTFDFDFLATDPRALDGSLWAGLEPPPEVRRGDADDPLAGVVRFEAPEVDVVVGRYRWQAEAVARAREMSVGGHSMPVVTLPDLILLKLHAGGYRDAVDVQMMLAGAGSEVLDRVEDMLPRLDDEARRLWEQIRG